MEAMYTSLTMATAGICCLCMGPRWRGPKTEIRWSKDMQPDLFWNIMIGVVLLMIYLLSKIGVKKGIKIGNSKVDANQLDYTLYLKCIMNVTI